MPKSTIQILQEAREIIAHKWSHGRLEDDNGNVCAMGAISQAAHGRSGYLKDFKNPIFGDAVNRLGKILTEGGDASLVGYQDQIIEYNDRAGQSQACMLVAFDAAIEAATIDA
jgi:hypothetical protein